MSNQAQIDALEHLLLAVLKSSIINGVEPDYLLGKARDSIMGENGPAGTTEKSNAAEYLNHLGKQFK